MANGNAFLQQFYLGPYHASLAQAALATLFPVVLGMCDFQAWY